MITPEKMESYNQNKVVEMYEKLNQDITKEIITKIKEVGYVSGYTMSQIKSIIKTGGKEIFKSALLKTNELSAGRKKEVLKVYNDIAEEMLKDYQAQYERVGADYGVSPDMIDLINYMAKATNETFKNMTKSVAFASKQEFTNAMDSLYKQVVSGQKDYASAMKQIISSLAEKGITLSSKGRNYSLESMVRLNLMTGLTQTTNDIAKKIGDIIDYNCVEIGHSYKCRPSHHPIDDVVMSKEEFKKYEYLTEEYNCYHIVNYDWREEFEGEDHKVEYGEEHQTLEETKRNYDIQQKARYYERQIRAKKQAIANGDTSIEARRELRNAQSKYKVYCNNNGLKIDHLRTWKVGYNNANYVKGLAGKNNTTETSHNPPKLLKTIDNITYKNVIKELENYEKIIKNDKIENAIVITTKGDVYQCFGNKNNVYPDVDLKDEITGAYITHNHPNIPENINTFTAQDRNLFYNNKLEVLRGIKGDYIFEMNRNNNFKENRSDLEKQPYDSDHVRNVKYSYDFNCGYKRWKNDK